MGLGGGRGLEEGFLRGLGMAWGAWRGRGVLEGSPRLTPPLSHSPSRG